ncbi:Protein CBG00805 [Caenorhabditis briggsae]|uniref:Solute carrier family 40 member n=1 Tax=Caenorhabditis briggsae TaxID=6238 RepID=A8WNV7_CAEBR|nr:Protein CBG00805 [Caenorhabditis briggsae]CAP22163.1 Protein CBG00805 [Caenorhabditis briggsae]
MFFGHSSICFSAINRLFLNAERSIMSRDWIVKILDSSRLSRQNATLTSLDQLINVLAPIGIGVSGVWISPSRIQCNCS